MVTSASVRLCADGVRANATSACSPSTIEAVNSTLDLQEVLALVATNVAEALEADACFVYLYDERADELVLRATHGTRDRRADAAAADAPRRGDHRLGGRGAGAGDARVAGASRSALQELPEPARGRVRVDPRRADPHARRHARGRAERPHARAARVRARTRSSCCSRSRRRSRSRSSTRSSTRRRSGACTSSRRSRASPKPSRTRSTSRSRSRRSSRRRWTRSTRPARRSCSTTAGSPGPRASPRRTRSASRCAGAAARSASSSPTARPPFTRRRPRAARVDRDARRGRARARAGGACGACSPRRSTTGSRTTCRRSRRCCGCRLASTDEIDPREALEHSVNRILAIAAVHELLTERREEDVDLADLLDRLRAMLVQGVGGGKEVTAQLEPVLAAGRARDRARAGLLRAAPERARARRRADPRRARAARRRGRARDRRRRRRACPTPARAPGLSIVQALVRDELRGTLTSRSDGGTRAEVVFPA